MAAINTKVKKAVIPVAGLGTRMLPATKAIPKEMLPLVDKPLIQYVVNECIAAGITEIVLVTHSSKNSIENHFDTSFELEAMLEKRVKRQLLDEVQSICPPHVTIMQVRQGLAKGLGHAVLCAHPVVGDEPVAVILPDVILDEYESDLSQDNLAEMIRRFDETGHSQIMVEPVADVTAYGVVDCKGVELAPGESVPMVGVVEKPKADVAPSNLAIVGRYVLSADIWPLLAKTPPGAGDEIQLTDAIDMLIEKGAYFIWYFHYMPVGNDAAPQLLPNPEQREYMYHRIREIRATKPIFAMDFQNDGEYVGGCIAGGRRYLHINANGDVDPCVFIHYSNANIRSCTLLEALQSPIFMAYHDGQPFNDNHLRPCPMLENPQILREIVEKTGAHSTDPQSPETADHLCAKCDEYAKNWQPTAERLWACSHDCSTCGAGCGKKD